MSSHAGPPPTDTLDPAVHAKRWLILATLCVSLLMIVMDNTILNVAIPKLVEDLHATNSQLQWIVDGYTLVFAGLLLTAGALGDRFGRKLALRIGISLFVIGSVASALSSTPGQLISARAFMGIGGALIMPSTLSILTNVFRDPKERGRAIAIWAGFSGVGVAAGPVIGGFLLNHFSWSSVFWVNLPIGVVALVAGYLFIPESKDPSAPQLDPVGALLSIVGLGSLLFAIIEGPTNGWTSTSVVIGFVVGIIAVGAFIAWESHSDHPMLDVSFFKNPRFSAANGAITLTFFAMFGSMFLMTQYWQFVHGYTPLEAGVRLVPFALMMMVVAPLSARVVERFGTKLVVSGGMGIVSLALVALATINAETSYLRVIICMMVMAGGMGLIFGPATESVMGSLPREKAGVGSAVNDTTRQTGGALGVAVIGSLVASVYASNVDTAATRLGISGDIVAQSRASLGDALRLAPTLGDKANAFVLAVREGYTDGLIHGMVIGAVIVAIAGLGAYLFLPARAVDPLVLEAEAADAAEAAEAAEAAQAQALAGTDHAAVAGS